MVLLPLVVDAAAVPDDATSVSRLPLVLVPPLLSPLLPIVDDDALFLALRSRRSFSLRPMVTDKLNNALSLGNVVTLLFPALTNSLLHKVLYSAGRALLRAQIQNFRPAQRARSRELWQGRAPSRERFPHPAAEIPSCALNLEASYIAKPLC